VRDSLRLGRVAGIPVAIHWSVLVVVLLLAWSLADGVLPQTAPGHSAATYWSAGFVGTVLLLASLLAHELAHAVVARRCGVEVEGLTLWLFGGVASLGGEAPTPRADLRIAAVGPATSLALGLGFGGLAVALDLAGVGYVVTSVAVWLATVNVLLAVFNLIPGAPLDGGRILRAILWQRSGDRDRAAASATSAGQLVGYLLAGLGVVSFVAGDSVGGIWLVLIGWFVMSAARAEHEATVSQHVLEGVTVADVMSPDVRTGSADLSIDAFVHGQVLGGRHSAYPVVGLDGGVVGLVTLAQLRGVPPGERATRRVRDVAVPLDHVARATPGEPLADLLPRLTPESGRRALVFDAGRLVGILTPADVSRTLETRQLLGRTESAGR
jgi:Zn-dependent protease/CBS domain-containing protein